MTPKKCVGECYYYDNNFYKIIGFTLDEKIVVRQVRPELHFISSHFIRPLRMLKYYVTTEHLEVIDIETFNKGEIKDHKFIEDYIMEKYPDE